jgi:hypothetical protein
MDVSDIIEYNAGLLNQNQLSDSWFCLKKDDPTAGFLYDASIVAGHTYPEVEVETESVGKHYILWGIRPSCWDLSDRLGMHAKDRSSRYSRSLQGLVQPLHL